MESRSTNQLDELIELARLSQNYLKYENNIWDLIINQKKIERRRRR